MKAAPGVFIQWCWSQGLPKPVSEYRFHPERRFRFDFAWPDHLLALEIQGGVWNRGAHGRGIGIVRDHEKFNLAATLGWRVLQVQPRDLLRSETITLARAALAWRNVPLAQKPQIQPGANA